MRPVLALDMRSFSGIAAYMVFGALLALPAIASAQDMFPDTPANHWAYNALQRARSEGLLVGYPDGLYRGTRPASRYELAVAFHEIYTKIKSSLDYLDAATKAGQNVNPNELDDLRQQIAAIKSALEGMKGYADDIADLKRASDTFELELEQLGVDVEAMRTEIGKLGSRVGALEKKKPPIDIRGETDFWAGAGNSRNGYYGLNKDGRIEGSGVAIPAPPSASSGALNPPVPYGVGLTEDLTTLHEAAFTLTGTDPRGPQWTGTVVVSDALGDPRDGTIGFGNQSEMFNQSYGTLVPQPVSGLSDYRPGFEDVYVQTLSAKFGGPQTNLQVGRLGYSISPYLFQRIDNNSYYENERWDNGQYYFDGAILGFDFKAAKLDVFGGRNTGLQSVNGVELNPLLSGPIGGPFNTGGTYQNGSRLDIDRSLGANLKVSVGPTAHVDLAYLFLDSNADMPLDVGVNMNRLDVYGGDGTAKVGPLDLQAGYHKTDLKANGDTLVGSDNAAWDVRLGTAQNRPYSVFGEYREVGANYLAPGDWGRLGILRDPSNIKGFRVGGSVGILKHLTVSATGEFDAGLSNNYSPSTFLGTGTGIDSYDVKIDYRLKPNLSLYGEYEDTRFGNLAAPVSYIGSGNPDYRWTTFGIGYGLASNARFDIQYELSDVDNDYQATNGVSFHGGFLTTQLTIRF